MKVEAIIIDGKKFVPIDEDCKYCELYGKCSIDEQPCVIFNYQYALKSVESEPDLNTKPQLEQMPVQVRTDCVYYKTCNGAGCCSKGLPGTICDIKDCVAYRQKPKEK